MSESKRRFPRFPVNLRLRLQLPGGELETTTDDVSASGFRAACTPAPEVGARLGFVLHLPDERQIAGEGEVVRTADGGGITAFEATFADPQRAEWEAFVDQERSNGGLWRMIGRYAVNQGEEKEAARSVLERGPLGILFKRIGGADEGAEAPVSTRLHMVGENGEAWRVAFEKHPGHAPDESDLAGIPGFLDFARVAVVRVLPQDVLLKRSAQAKATAERVVELKKGGFAILVRHANAPPSFAGLHGAELIAVEIDGKPVFPFFDASDLDRIALDNFRRDEERAPAEAPAVPLKAERFAASYAHKELATGNLAKSTHRDVRDAMAAAQRVQTRRYGDRTIRLFPELWLEVLRPKQWPGPLRGFAMEDGLQLCVFVLVGQDAPRVVAIAPDDAIAIIRGPT